VSSAIDTAVDAFRATLVARGALEGTAATDAAEVELGCLQAGVSVTVDSVDRRYVLSVSTFSLDRSHAAERVLAGPNGRLSVRSISPGATGD
jgi:hypothetical protein